MASSPQPTTSGTPETPDRAKASAPVLTTFPPDDCDAGLLATTVLHEYLFAEFQPALRRVGQLQATVTLDFPHKGSDVVGADTHLARTAWMPALARPALQTYGGVPVSRAFDEDLGDLTEPLVPGAELDDVLPLLNERSGHVTYPGGTATVELDDDAVADLVAGRETLVRGRDGERRPVLLRLRGPAAQTSTQPLQRLYHVGTAEGFIRSPYVAAVDGSNLRLALTGQQLLALHNDGQTALEVNGQQVTLVAGVPGPVSASYAATAVTGQTNPGEGLMSTETRDSTAGSGSAAETSRQVEPTPQGQLQLVLYLPWRHTWRLAGYSRGELLHTLALAPQEEATIEVTSWDRYKRTYEESAESSFEQSRDFTQTDKDSHAVVRDIANGSSFGLSIGGSVGYSSGGFNVTGTNSADARANLNSASKTTFDSMSEAVTRSSMKLRLQRQTKVGETSEIGTENKVTRRVRNPNLCHTLLLNYYEILAHYTIEIAFNVAEARLCVLVPTAGLVEDEFTYTNLRYYQSVLERVLLVPALAPGFDAAHRLVAQDKLCEARARLAMCGAAQNLHDAAQDDAQKIHDQLVSVIESYDSLATAQRSAHLANIPGSIATWNLIVDDLAKFDRWLYLRRAHTVEPHLFLLLAQFSNQLATGQNNLTTADARHLVDVLAEVDLTSISSTRLRQDQDTLLMLLKDEFGLSHNFSYLGVPDEAYAVTDGGLMTAISAFRQMVQDLGDTQQAAEATDVMAVNQAAALAEAAAKETAGDLEAVDALTTHLNAYRNYYRTAIFQLMPWPEKFEQILALYDTLIERQVIGFSGDNLALPVNLDLSEAARQFFDTMVTDNPELTSRRSVQSVSLPTSGVHLENRLGRCGGCEGYIEQLRRLDLETKAAELDAKREVAQQQKLETQRYRHRLDAHEYDDPVTRQTTLRIEQVADGDRTATTGGAAPPPGGPAPTM